MSEEKTNKGPEKKFRAGAVSATIWKNTQKGKDDKEYDFHTVTIERNYMDKEDKWQSTNQFRKNDLANVELVRAKAYEYLTLKTDEE